VVEHRAAIHLDFNDSLGDRCGPVGRKDPPKLYMKERAISLWLKS